MRIASTAPNENTKSLDIPGLNADISKVIKTLSTIDFKALQNIPN